MDLSIDLESGVWILRSGEKIVATFNSDYIGYEQTIYLSDLINEGRGE